MNEDPNKQADASQDGAVPGPVTPQPVVSTSPKPPDSRRLLKIIAIILAAVVAAGVMLVAVVVFLVLTGAFLFINHCQDNYQTADGSAKSIEAKMKTLTINGTAPASVVGAVDYANGEDFTCSSNVPSVDATFHVQAQTVTAAQADVLRSLRAKAAGTFTIVRSAGYSASGLDQPINMSSGESYVVRYYFPAAVPYDPPNENCLSAMPKPKDCQDDAVVAANHLTDQQVANIRLSNR